MSLPKSKAARKAALAAPKAAMPKKHERPPVDGYGMMLAHPFIMAQAIANEAVNNRRYQVIAAASRNTAGTMKPLGFVSTEYAPGYAVPTGGERKRFSREDIAEETRRSNIEAEKRARVNKMIEVAFEDAFKEARQNDPLLARHEMGDFIDEAAYAGSYLQ